MSTTATPRRDRRRRNNRDYRPGHFQPRWACEEDGCRADGTAPADTAPADLLTVLQDSLRAHMDTAHP